MTMPRNVVLLVADSLRWDSVNTGGDHRLPYLAGRGRAFHQARAAGCWTLPAHASMFSGLSPHEHGADSQTRAIRQVPTLAERMKLLGYSTHMITANVATTEVFGLDRGFDTLDRIWKFVPGQHKKLHEALVLVGKPRLRKRMFSKDFVMGKLSEDIDASKVWLQSTSRDVFDRARTILDANEARGKRSFVFMNLMETHFPYHVSDAFETSAEGIIGKIREVWSLFHLVNQTWLTTDKAHISADMLNVLRRRQRLAWERLAPMIDAFVQELREKYDASVVFCADHGDNFGEQDWLYHFSNVTDAGNRVPMVVLPHDHDLGDSCDVTVSARDLFGTILRLAGDRDPTLLSLLDDPHRSLPVLESFWYNNNGKTLPQYRFNQWALIEGDQRFVHRQDGWYTAAATQGCEPEARFEALPTTVNPLFDAIRDRSRREAALRSFGEFQQFSDRVMQKTALREAA
jgi:arylsulfatase A-like enzyme